MLATANLAILNLFYSIIHFKDFECSGNTGEEKSKNITRILHRNNISFAIYVGDTEKDYYASKVNNLPFIWASYGFGICEKYDWCINDISELKKIVYLIF